MKRQAAGLITSLAMFLILGGGCTQSGPQRTITGQVFIVTAGRETIKMALVEVGAVRLEDIRVHLRRRGAAADSLRAEIDSTIEREREHARVVAERFKRDEAIAKRVEIQYIRSEVDTRAWEASKQPPFDDARDLEATVQRIQALQTRRNELGSDMAFHFETLPTPLASAKTDADGKFTLTVPGTDSLVIVARTDRQTLTGKEDYYWIVRLPPKSERESPLLLSNDNLSLPLDLSTMIR